jgi:hypothetical protein
MVRVAPQPLALLPDGLARRVRRAFDEQPQRLPSHVRVDGTDQLNHTEIMAFIGRGQDRR